MTDHLQHVFDDDFSPQGESTYIRLSPKDNTTRKNTSTAQEPHASFHGTKQHSPHNSTTHEHLAPSQAYSSQRIMVEYPTYKRKSSHQKTELPSEIASAAHSANEHAPSSSPHQAPLRTRNSTAAHTTSRQQHKTRQTPSGKARSASGGAGVLAIESEYAPFIDNQRVSRQRRPLLFGIALILLALVGVGGYFFFNPLSVDVTINGTPCTIGDGCTLGVAVKKSPTTPQPGNLQAVDGSILEVGGGNKFTATINGNPVTEESTRLRNGDVLVISDGTDTTEPFETFTQEVPFEVVEEGSGSLHRYANKGLVGEEICKTGSLSGLSIIEESKAPESLQFVKFNPNTRGDKVIALTFDDGPWPESTEQILDILAENNAKATFFTIGRCVEERPDIVKRAHNEGHQICTHSYDHAEGTGKGVDLSLMTEEEQKAEIEKGYATIETALGSAPSHVFRAPGGNYHSNTIRILEPYVEVEVGWNIDTQDWRQPGASSIASQITSAKPGYIVLMHDGGGDRSQTVEALKEALPQLTKEGYRFITIDELIAYNAS